MNAENKATDIKAQVVDQKTNQSEAELISISVFGLGYVGAVSAACYSECGHRVIGVDPDQGKADIINAGQSPIVEPGLEERLKDGVAAGRIAALTSAQEAVHNTDVSFVCVGTPSAADGSCDLGYLRQVSEQIGEALKTKDAYHVITFRSTVPPGTVRKVMQPIIEQTSGKLAGEDFGLGFHPEFLRESTAVDDFHNPPKTVVGGIDQRSIDVVADIYRVRGHEVIETSLEAAEMVKYVDNTWHATKVSFANEIGKICQAANVDSHTVMDIFCQDRILNISSYYMKPGFAFGGSCLPKDVRGINHLANRLGVETPLLNHIMASNQAQIDFARNLILDTGAKSVGFLGITFKANTDDLRESPMLPVIETLLDAGVEVRIYDPNVNLESSLRHHLQHSKHKTDGAKSLMERLPELMRDSVGEVMAEVGTVVVSHNSPLFRNAVLTRKAEQRVVDLVRIFDSQEGWPEMIKAGMSDYLQKPASKDMLRDMLLRWSGRESLDNLSVLLAEDDPAYQRVTRAILESLGITVHTASNGVEALKIFSSEYIDLILMDVFMPFLDGIATTHRIRALSSGKGAVPIIALTAHAAPEQSETYAGICW